MKSNTFFMGVLVLERQVVDQEPHDVVRVHGATVRCQGSSRVPCSRSQSISPALIRSKKRPLHAEPVVHVVASVDAERLHVGDLVVGDELAGAPSRTLLVEERADRRVPDRVPCGSGTTHCSPPC